MSTQKETKKKRMPRSVRIKLQNLYSWYSYYTKFVYQTPESEEAAAKIQEDIAAIKEQYGGNKERS